MAMPYGLGEDPVITLRSGRQSTNKPVDDYSIIPDACRLPMVDNGDGTWTVPQLTGACAVPICYAMYKKYPLEFDRFTQAIGSGNKDLDVTNVDYPWHGGDRGFGLKDEATEAIAIANWYVKEMKISEGFDPVSTKNFLVGILEREGWLSTPTPLRRNTSNTEFEVPQGAETPGTGVIPEIFGPGTAFGQLGDMIAQFWTLFDPVNIVRFLAIAVGLGLVLFGARKLV